MEADKIILIPSFNELTSLKLICKKLKKYKLQFLVLDDCSKDGSNKWLKKNKIKFIKNNKNLGYEKNIINGFYNTLRNKKIKYVITFDGDGQHKVNDILKLIKILNKQDFDLLICNRKNMNRWSEYILSFFFYFKFRIRDPLTGFKVYNIKVLKKFLKKLSNNHFLVDLVVFIKKSDYKIFNYTIRTKKKTHSRTGENLKIHFKILKNLKFIFS